MPEVRKGTYRLIKVAREINLGVETIAEHLIKKGFEIEAKPSTKITQEMYDILISDFRSDIAMKERAEQVTIGRKKRESLKIDAEGKILSIVTEVPPAIIEEEKPADPKATEEETTVKTATDLVEEPVAEVVEAVEVPKVEEVKEVEELKEVEKKVEEVEVKEAPPVAEPVAEEVKEVPVVKEEVVPEPVAEVIAEAVEVKEESKVIKAAETSLDGPKVIGKIDLDSVKKTKSKSKSSPQSKKEKPKKEVKKVEPKKVPKVETPVVEKKVEKPVVQRAKEKKADKPLELHKSVVPVLEGPKILGKIVLPTKEDKASKTKKKRKRIVKRTDVKRTGSGTGSGTGGSNTNRSGNNSSGNNSNNRTSGGGGRGRTGSNRTSSGRTPNRRGRPGEPPQISEKEIQEKIKATMAKLGGGGKSSRQKIRRSKRDSIAEKEAIKTAHKEEQNAILQVTEFITVSELASLMDITPTEIISACMSIGSFVSINQRLDAELIDLVTEEFGFKVQFIDVSDTEEEEEYVDAPEDLIERAPIVTIMGHVDHGKTSLLDYIRKANVIGGEVGGITQHIGAYEVKTESGKKIAFLDTPGHEAFTAMRARGAKVTDIAVIVVAADDAVMPQTKEAISHAQAAGVPMIFAINKVDRDISNPEKIKEQLAQMNLLVESWGGEFQSEDISAKTGLNVDSLLEKILLVSEFQELKANPNRPAIGSVIEASLDKGRGYVATILVQNGTLKVGDAIVAGSNFGKVKAMFDERGQRLEEAGPSTPVLVLGLNGAPQAGEKIKAYVSEAEAKEVALKREAIVREQGRRTKKHITLEEIGRRLALENFKELNLIVKGDVDGSVEALSDSLLQLSTEEIQISVIHKSVGQISETDVLLASASDAIIIGFQVRPSLNARKLAEKEDIDIRMYSIIYDAIAEIKSAMEGMLEPTIEEKVVCTVRVQEVYKITKVGTIAGCLVQEGKIKRNTKVRLVRDGIVKFTGEISGLKRFKDDVKEVANNTECGISLKNYADIKEDDIIEGYEEVEIKRTL